MKKLFRNIKLYESLCVFNVLIMFMKRNGSKCINDTKRVKRTRKEKKRERFIWLPVYLVCPSISISTSISKRLKKDLENSDPMHVTRRNGVL